jgi:glutaconate CoA-transferase subunit A
MNNYRESRRKIVEKNKGVRDKTTTLEEAVKMIQDGDHVAIGGLQYTRTPVGALWEIIRQKKKNLTFYKTLMSFEGDWLFVSGAMRKAVTSWFSGGVTWGVSKIMRAYAEKDPNTFEEWSLMGLSLRFRAGAMGIPSIPAKTMLGSDLEKITDLKRFTCPYSEEELLLIPALNPDVAVIHSQAADIYGNAQIYGPPCMDIDIAKASNRVILTTEQIIDNDAIRDAPNCTNIPFFCVDAVVELPFGCYPLECYGRYEPAYDKMGDYGQGLLEAEDKMGFVKGYLDKFFYGPADFEEYLSLFGMKSLMDTIKKGRIWKL